MALGADLVLETVNAPGTATFNLAGTSTGRRTFLSGFGTGVQVYYTAHDGASWEIGYGIVTSGAPNTLSRDTVIENSLGTTAKINFTTSTNVYADIPSKRKPWASADNLQMLMGTRRVSGLAAGTAVDDAPRLDQVDIRVGTYSVASNVIVVPLPNATDIYELLLVGLLPVVTAALFFRVSIDNGATYQSGATEYNYIAQSDVGNATPAASAAAISYAPLGVQSVVSTISMHGTFILSPAYKTWRCDLQAHNGTWLTRERTSGTWTTGGTITHLLFGSVTGSNLASGSVHLTRKA